MVLGEGGPEPAYAAGDHCASHGAVRLPSSTRNWVGLWYVVLSV